MIYVFEEEICDCGSLEVFNNPAEYTADGKWSTKAEREADPTIQISTGPIPLVYIGDPTWYTCCGCEKDIEPEVVKKQLDKYRELFNALK